MIVLVSCWSFCAPPLPPSIILFAIWIIQNLIGKNQPKYLYFSINSMHFPYWNSTENFEKFRYVCVYEHNAYHKLFFRFSDSGCNCEWKCSCAHSITWNWKSHLLVGTEHLGKCACCCFIANSISISVTSTTISSYRAIAICVNVAIVKRKRFPLSLCMSIECDRNQLYECICCDVRLYDIFEHIVLLCESMHFPQMLKKKSACKREKWQRALVYYMDYIGIAWNIMSNLLCLGSSKFIRTERELL